MQPRTQASPVSNKRRIWTGGVISTLAALFLLFDSIIHLMKPGPVVEAFAQLGYPMSLAFDIGILELVGIVLFAIPSTSILGAVLLTGYLGGATASQVRVGHPLFTETLFPVHIGVLVWGGRFLREDRLRALFPLRS